VCSVTTSTAVDRLGAERYVMLTTYRKDGTAVPTVVWPVTDGTAVYVWTSPKTGKVKRILRRPEVTLAPCTFRGKLRGDAVAAVAEVCDDADSERVRGLVKRKYRVQGRFLVNRAVRRGGPTGTVGVRITFPA